MKRLHVLLIAAGLLCLYWWMATSVSDTQCTTGDEIAHLTAGYSYWKTDDYRLQPENGNLPQRWAAIPLLAGDFKFPTLDQDAWRISDVWDLGFQWFYENGNDLASMLRAGRRMIALFGVGLGALTFLWARRLHGDRAALLATFLFAFCPTMLANGGLVTSDMTAACMFLAAVTAFWAMAHRLTPLRVLVFGLVLGLLCVAKFSAPLIAPMCALLWVVRVAGKDTLESGWPFGSLIAGRAKVAFSLIGATLVSCALALLVIWASYGFRYAMYRQFEPNRVRSLVGWDVLEDHPGPMVTAFAFVRDHKLLPESYVYGLAHSYRFSLYRKSFLNGEYRSTGWVQFFPYTTAVKTPLALFALMALAGICALSLRRTPAEWRDQRLPVVPSPRALRRLLDVLADDGAKHRPPPHHPGVPNLLHRGGGRRRVGRPADALDGGARRPPRRVVRGRVRLDKAPDTSPTSTRSSRRPRPGSTWSTARSTGARTFRHSSAGLTPTRRRDPSSSPTSARATSTTTASRRSASATLTSTCGRARCPAS